MKSGLQDKSTQFSLVISLKPLKCTLLQFSKSYAGIVENSANVDVLYGKDWLHDHCFATIQWMTTKFYDYIYY